MATHPSWLGDNLVWWSLILKLVAPDGASPAGDLQPSMAAQAKETLFRLLDEFFELHTEHDGLRQIYAAHEAWPTFHRERGCKATGAETCPGVGWPRASSYRAAADSGPPG